MAMKTPRSFPSEPHHPLIDVDCAEPLEDGDRPEQQREPRDEGRGNEQRGEQRRVPERARTRSPNTQAVMERTSTATGRDTIAAIVRARSLSCLRVMSHRSIPAMVRYVVMTKTSQTRGE